MLSVIEKVMVLQNVEDFSEVSTEELGYLAMIAEEIDHSPGEMIYAESDPADAMYLVLEGRIQLHRGSLEVSLAEVNQAFGTWALFDNEPRVTSATAVDRSRTLRIRKEDFIDLLADHVGITEGVLKALVKRVRALVGRVSGDAGAGGRSN